MDGTRKPYPSDVSDGEWALVAPYLTLLPEEAGQRVHPLREVFNGLRYVVKTGAPWRWMPNDLPPWEIVYQQAQRWLRAGCFEGLVDDLRCLLRLAAGRGEAPRAAILDSRTLRSTPESGARAGYDGAKRKKGSKLHMAVDTLGHLLALHVAPELLQVSHFEGHDVPVGRRGVRAEQAAHPVVPPVLDRGVVLHRRGVGLEDPALVVLGANAVLEVDQHDHRRHAQTPRRELRPRSTSASPRRAGKTGLSGGVWRGSAWMRACSC